MTLLQVALDVTDLKKAIEIARVVKADILEAGTPLIKKEGVKAISLLSVFGDVLADMKTCDTGALEAQMAFEAGAKYVTVMGFVDNAVIEEALTVAEKFGGEVVVDLMYVPDPIKRAEELKKIGVKIVSLHVGISQQKAYGKGAESLLDLVEKIREIGLKVSVAGGIRPETAKLFANKADIVVVGGYITKAEDPKKASEEILEALGRRP